MLSDLDPQRVFSAAVARVREDPVGFWMSQLDLHRFSFLTQPSRMLAINSSGLSELLMASK